MPSLESEEASRLAEKLQVKTRLLLKHLTRNYAGSTSHQTTGPFINRVSWAGPHYRHEELVHAAEHLLRAEEHLRKAAFRQAEEAMDAVRLIQDWRDAA